jgi:GTP-binding protein Era
MHKAGYVSIVGLPNAGKSTLLNAFAGEKLSIVTHKPQTTRLRIKAFVTTDDYQIVFYDTPGIIDPKYKLQEAMMKHVEDALSDAEVVLLVVDGFQSTDVHQNIEETRKRSKKKWLLALNKVDNMNEERLAASVNDWSKWFDKDDIFPISALAKAGLNTLIYRLVSLLPEHPPYYAEDEVTDVSVRFIVGEMIREQMLFQYRDEIPYSVEIIVEEFKEQEHLTKIRAFIAVERETQKAIVIGNKGISIKKLGTIAREQMEKFLGRKVYLDLSVKVKPNWRNDSTELKRFGYG